VGRVARAEVEAEAGAARRGRRLLERDLAVVQTEGVVVDVEVPELRRVAVDAPEEVGVDQAGDLGLPEELDQRALRGAVARRLGGPGRRSGRVGSRIRVRWWRRGSRRTGDADGQERGKRRMARQSEAARPDDREHAGTSARMRVRTPARGRWSPRPSARDVPAGRVGGRWTDNCGNGPENGRMGGPEVLEKTRIGPTKLSE